MNRWNIPEKLEKEIIVRDTHCVYCGIKMIEKIKKTVAPIVKRALRKGL